MNFDDQDGCPNDETLREANERRLRTLAASGTPVQLNGYTDHMLEFIIKYALSPEALEACHLSWEQHVSKSLDNIDIQIRMAKLAAPAGGLAHP